MTLIITELSSLGIAMVADTAVTFNEPTPSGDKIARVLTGAQKVQPIPFLGAGISMWGLGEINTQFGPVSTDVWTADFTRRHTDAMSIHMFAEQLALELQEAVGDREEPLGFHLAGHVHENGEHLATLYHVRNVDGPYGNFDFHEFVPGHDIPPQSLKQNDIHRTRNGDFGPYAVLADAVERALPRIEEIAELRIPYPSLQARVSYLVAWVKFVSDLYATSGALRTIGGGAAALSITPQGQISFYPA